MSNSVKLYSNGTAEISEDITLEPGKSKKISIPVKRDALDEVVASLDIFGNVDIPEPPSYTPSNAKPSTLVLDPNNISRDLATKLVGADIVVKSGSTSVKGRLLGIQRYDEITSSGITVERWSMSVLDSEDVNTIRTFREYEIQSMRFPDPVIQGEIDKSLQQSMQKIKPDSTYVDFTISARKDAKEARVQYCVPGAAWKMRYHLRRDKDAWELAGHAVVDNFTDADWNNVVISVITGQPIAFSTDLAEVCRPGRSRVKLVPDSALGAVTASDDMPTPAWNTENDQEGVLRAKSIRPQNAFALCASAAGPAPAAPAPLPRAEQPSAEVKEVGDFSEYTAAFPVTIKANKQAVIPMFTTGCSGTPVLLYKEEENATRPWQAVRFKNDTRLSLARGSCEIFLDGANAGKCVLDAIKPTEEALLVHALETGVKIFKEVGNAQSKRVSIAVKDGLIVCETSNQIETRYRIKNNKPEQFKLEIEHLHVYRNSKTNILSSAATWGGDHKTVDIPGGTRIMVDLPPETVASKGITVVVMETVVDETRWDVSNNVSWLQSNIVAIKHPLASKPAIRKVIELQGDLNKAQQAEREAAALANELRAEQKRLVEMIPSGHANDQNQWRTELGEAETQLKELKKTKIPELRAATIAANETLQQALAKLCFSWSEAQPAGESDSSGK